MLIITGLFIALFGQIKCQPPAFIPLDFEVDKFQVSRGYFSPLDNKANCWNSFFNQDCIYSNFINSPNILFLKSSPSSTTYTTSFKLRPNEAVVIGGFAPPLSQRFTITPYASFLDGIPSFSSISNNSLSLDSTYFVAVITGDLYTYSLIREWFRTANTSLTTAIYNNPDRYLFNIPIVQINSDLNIDEHTKYSVIIRHETINSLQQDLYYVFSQLPSLLAWKVSVTDDIYDPTQSEIVTELDQIRVPGYDEWMLTLEELPINNYFAGKSQIHRIRQNRFAVVDYDSSECLSSGLECSYDQPDSVIFESPQFRIRCDHSCDKIWISGINHIKTGNAKFATINIVDSDDRSVVSQISLNEMVSDETDGYVVVFSSNCDGINDNCVEINDMDNVDGVGLRIVEISSNDIGIDASDLQPPQAIITEKPKPKRRRPTRRVLRGGSSDESYSEESESESDDVEQYEEDEEDEKRRRKPNIVMIMTDDLGWKDVGYNGAEYDTPIIDGLAESGIILNQYYVHPICSPTRAALYTGRYAFRYDLTTPLDYAQDRHLPMDVQVLPEVLSANGYDTHLVGKWYVKYTLTYIQIFGLRVVQYTCFRLHGTNTNKSQNNCDGSTV